MRRIAAILAVIAAGAAGVAATAGADDSHTYEIEMYNAFGLVQGSDVRIAGVNAGSVSDLDISADKTAIVTVELTGALGTLGEDSKCTSEPQSLIAEYFISCEPNGPPIEEDDDADDPQPDIPATQVSQTVQQDLVQNTLREPFKQRLQLLINEFGTALAGNPERLNAAIRAGAPALTQLRKVTKLLASQNTIIRDLQGDSDAVISRLTERREDVVRFIQEARDTAEASAARRIELSRDFEILDDFLGAARPTLAELETVAREQQPLLADLRGAAPGLNTLVKNLPGFSKASEDSLDGLGEASVVGETALRRGADEIEQLADAGQKAPFVAEALSDLFRDLDDPARAVEIDQRVEPDTGRTGQTGGKKNTEGYTGLEGLLNYAYYQPGALNQYDQIGHALHFTLYNVFTGQCGSFSSGRDEETGEPGLPALSGAGETTTNILEAARCVGGLGPNQPGINEDLGFPAYDPSVCPTGTTPEVARETLCNPEGTSASRANSGSSSEGAGRGEGVPETTATPGAGGGDGAAAPDQAAPEQPATPAEPDGPLPQDLLDEILNLPPSALDDLPENLQNELNDLTSGVKQGLQGGSSQAAPAPSGGGLGANTGAAAEQLLDFLFAD